MPQFRNLWHRPDHTKGLIVVLTNPYVDQQKVVKFITTIKLHKTFLQGLLGLLNVWIRDCEVLITPVEYLKYIFDYIYVAYDITVNCSGVFMHFHNVHFA